MAVLKTPVDNTLVTASALDSILGTIATREFDYAQITVDATSNATSAATATAVITGGSVIYDGATIVLVDFQCICQSGAGAMDLELYDNATDLGLIGQLQASSTVLLRGSERLTPTAGAHVYSLRVWNGTAVTATIKATPPTLPAYLRVSRV